MSDLRVQSLARVLCDYSMELKAGDILRIRAETIAEPLVREVYKLAVQRGAHPLMRLSFAEQMEIFMKHAPEDALDFVSPLAEHETQMIDADLSIWGEANTQALSRIDPARQARSQKAHFPIAQKWMARAFTPNPSLRWVGTLFPVPALAQDAHMSLGDYEDFVYHAMLLDTPDPVQAWHDFSQQQARLRDILAQHDEIRITAEDTDIRASTKGRTWISADGRLNFPDGEIFTGPVENTVNGHIRYTFPTIYAGREAEDVHLWFEDGRVVRWEAKTGKALLDELFAMDEGARYLGELAIGNNFAIPQFTKNILFDEKIGGTCHLAVGASIPMTGGKNQSALHWDMVCDLRSGGAVYGDGELLQEDGVWRV